MTAKLPRARLLAAPHEDHSIAAPAPEGALDLRRVRRRRWFRFAFLGTVSLPWIVLAPWWGALPWVAFLVLYGGSTVRSLGTRNADRVLTRVGKLIALGRLDAAERLLDRRARSTPELYEDGGVAVSVLRMHLAERRHDREAALVHCDLALAAMGDAPRWAADRRLDTQLTRVELLLDLARIDDAEAQAATTFPAARQLPELRTRATMIEERVAAKRIAARDSAP